MKRITFQLAVLLFFSLNACKKNGPNEAGGSTKKGFLTNGTWKLTGVISDDDGNGSYETDDFAMFPACFTDNLIVFASNFQVEINEGPTKCDPGDPQIETGTWSLTNNENNLMVNSDSYPLLELSNSTLKWREDGPANTSSIVTMTKQ